MEHISQCNQSESLADARGKIVDLMKEHEILRAHHVYFFNQRTVGDKFVVIVAKFWLICLSSNICQLLQLKHTTTLFALHDHHILNREWRVNVDQVQTNYHGRPIVL